LQIPHQQTFELALHRGGSSSQLQYRQGSTDLLTVLQLAQTTLTRLQAVVHLYEALGGGWVQQPGERTQFAALPRS
jgi:outer membrane protein TolC